MAKVKVINNNLDQNVNGDNFDNTTSQTIFNFGKFKVSSNFDGRTPIDYNNQLSTFVKPVTLDSLNLTDAESENILFETKNAVLNLDNSDLNTFTKFGSAYEFLRISVENIILNYPGSLLVNSEIENGGNITFFDFYYNDVENISKFKIPSLYVDNKFGLVFNQGNQSLPNDNELKNLNLSYYKYVVWSTLNPNNNSHTIVGFTGDTNGRSHLMVECLGNPFPEVTGSTTTGRFNIHLKPNTRVFEDFRLKLKKYEKYIVSTRKETKGFEFSLKEPILLDNGQIDYNEKTILWTTNDGYNIDVNTPQYETFINILLTIGDKYDQIKTNLIARFLTPKSIQTYDLTENKKMNKLLKIYGAEFDQIKQFIDSLVYINKTTYDKKKNLPDQIVGNLAKTFGWDYFRLVKEEELVDKILETNEPERDVSKNLTPAEVDIELWRRILINTNYFWKSKGTRDAIKSMFLLIGIPEPFINITEYVYTVDGKIDPRNVRLTLDDLPSASLPYNDDGYPIAPIETDNYYFQMSGDSDSGQAYLDNFRAVGFNLSAQVDNKKSWIETGSTYRTHHTSPTYYQLDSNLVLNTKEIDIALDISIGIEYDVYRYIKEFDFPANSSGYTMPYSFVNLSLGVGAPSQQQFTLPLEHEGDFEVRFNGILLNSDKIYDGSGTTTGNTEADYSISGNTLTLIGGSAQKNSTDRDVVQVSYIYSGETQNPITGLTVSYIVTRVLPQSPFTKILLPEIPAGDVQLTINGVAATKGTSQFYADYTINPNNNQELIIQNPDLISYFSTNPYTQIAMVHVNQSNVLNARNEIIRVDSLVSGKVYYNTMANKTVLKLNYKISDAKNVKILINGIALEPNTDYTVNYNNPYELYLPPNINLGTVISAYYLVAEDLLFEPVISNEFGLGDISKLSFLEFTELLYRKTINATNRKVITDFKGGWYPTLLKIYDTYLKRSNLLDNNPLKSNGYTFSNLYPFLSKYNAFFQRFVDQLLSATIIQKKGGLLIRNTIFTQQKYTYKRGVSFDLELNYLGSDGAIYLKRPKEQVAKWSDDEICISYPCNKFVVNNIHVTYPTTTTTTTAQPLDTTLSYDLESAINNSIDNDTSGEYGNYIEERYIITFSPLLTDYEIDSIPINIYSEYKNGATSSGDGKATTSIEIRKNESTIYNKTNVNDTPSTNWSQLMNDIFTPTNISEEDVLEVIIYNEAISSLSSPSELVELRSTITFDIENAIVKPNGSVISAIPTNIIITEINSDIT